MQTLRKLPTQSPRIPAPTSRMGSTATRHLIEQNTRRHRDVERLGPLRQRDCDAPGGDGIEVRADAGPLVSHHHGDRVPPPPPPPPPPPAPPPRPGGGPPGGAPPPRPPPPPPPPAGVRRAHACNPVPLPHRM